MSESSRSAPMRSASAEEEAGHWRALREGSPMAREALFRSYMPFAQRIAMRHLHDRTAGDVELEDLRQLAYAGLLEALARFDAARGVPFRAFAARRISGSILDGISKMSELREQIAFRGRVRRERVDSLGADGAGRRGAANLLRDLAELATGLAIGFMLDSGMVVSGDAVDDRPNAYEGLAWRQTLRRLVAEVAALPPREKTIIEQHYRGGLDFESIGLMLGVSKGRVSQIHKGAIQRLREAIKAVEGTH